MKNEKLIEQRKKTGLTQSEVARRARVSDRAYQNYESGERIPQADVAIRIADVLGVKSFKLFKEIFG